MSRGKSWAALAALTAGLVFSQGLLSAADDWEAVCCCCKHLFFSHRRLLAKPGKIQRGEVSVELPLGAFILFVSQAGLHRNRSLVNCVLLLLLLLVNADGGLSKQSGQSSLGPCPRAVVCLGTLSSKEPIVSSEAVS